MSVEVTVTLASRGNGGSPLAERTKQNTSVFLLKFHGMMASSFFKITDHNNVTVLNRKQNTSYSHQSTEVVETSGINLYGIQFIRLMNFIILEFTGFSSWRLSSNVDFKRAPRSSSNTPFN